MKSYFRRLAQAAGLYQAIAIVLAKIQGVFRGIQVTRTGDSVFCLSDRKGRRMFINEKHAIYLTHFVKYFDFNFNGVVPDEKNEVHYEKAGWHTPRQWGRPLYFTSFAESEEVMSLYLNHGEVGAGDIIFDLGAYCGLTALGFAERIGEKGHVYTFEPDPNNFAALKQNLDTYAVANVTAENAAIWKESGHIQLQAEGTVASMVVSLSPRADSSVRVRSITLNDYLLEKKISRLDLIKIDVEGAEVEILASSREVLRKHRPIIIVEVHAVHEVMTTDACKAVLEEEGYQTYEVPQPGTTFPLIVAKPGKSR